MPDPLMLVHDEIEAGLVKHAERMTAAKLARDYAEGRNRAYLEARPQESWADYRDRPKRYRRLALYAVGQLCAHLYTPGPVRSWEGDEAVEEYLEATYERLGINAVMRHADTLATIGGVCAIETAVEDDGLLRLYTYGSDEFTAWTSFRDPLTPWAVCTKTCDPLDQVTEYRLWTADERRTYRTRSAAGRTAGGRVADLVETVPNPLGRLPFTYVWYQPPVDTFWVDGVGGLLAEANADLDRALSDLAQAVREHLCPIGLARNVDPRFRLHRIPGGFQVLPKDAAGKTGEGAEPKLEYLQAVVDVESALREAESYADATLQDLGIPLAPARGDASASSGIALLIEDLPLLTRYRSRQPTFARYEDTLARLVALVGLGREPAGSLACHWPDVVSILPDATLQEADERDLALGLTSRLEILQRRRGITREAAIELLQRLESDRLEEARIAQGILAPEPEAEAEPEAPDETADAVD